MEIEQPKIFLCDVCKTRKTDVKKIKTYNGSSVTACPSCQQGMKMTLEIMKRSAKDVVEVGKIGKYAQTGKIGVLTPI